MAEGDHYETVSFGAMYPEDPELTAAGWRQRYLADQKQAAEAKEQYEALGFEVRFEKLPPEAFGDHCGDCRSVACTEYVMIYTRRRRGPPGGASA